MKRRPFIQSIPLATAAYWAAVEKALAGNDHEPIPQRAYNAEVNLSIVGFGAIVLMGQEQPAANDEVARAVDRGINYFDVAPSYGKGEAERKLGPALKPYREKVFLACKTGKRDLAGARVEFENSLKTLQTDRFDLYQLHNMHRPDDIEKAFAPGGVMELMVKAREEGKVRYLGFSAHDEEVALELLDRFEWDSVLFPVNYVCFAVNGFGRRLVEKAKAKNVARLALKALAHTPWDSKEAKRPVDMPSAGTARSMTWRRCGPPFTLRCRRMLPAPFRPAKRRCTGWPRTWRPALSRSQKTGRPPCWPPPPD
jgi:aryl-alcohol dehydrogenase-like predicted oxidoreductase